MFIFWGSFPWMCFSPASAACHASTPRRFRFAVSLYAAMGDFGWPFHLNVARINLQKYLTSKYPALSPAGSWCLRQTWLGWACDMITEHTFASTIQAFTGECDPQYVKWVREGYNLIFGTLYDVPCLPAMLGYHMVLLFLHLGCHAPSPEQLWFSDFFSDFFKELCCVFFFLIFVFILQEFVFCNFFCVLFHFFFACWKLTGKVPVPGKSEFLSKIVSLFEILCAKKASSWKRKIFVVLK